VFVEYWQDMPALITHFALQDSQDFVRDLQPLLSEKPEMRIFDADEIQR
jgi:quinol monooxygenase YgiN